MRQVVSVAMTPQDAYPYAMAARSMREGLPVYGDPPPPHYYTGELAASHVWPYVAPPPSLPLVLAVDAVAPVMVALPLLAVAAGARALVLARDPLVALVALPPLLMCYRWGQTAPVLWWAVAALVWGGPTEAGIALALAAALKAWPVALVGWLCVTRDRRGWVALGILVALGLLAWDYWPAWLAFVAEQRVGLTDNPNNWRVW